MLGALFGQLNNLTGNFFREAERTRERWLLSLKKASLGLVLLQLGVWWLSLASLLLLGALFIGLAHLPFLIPLVWTGLASLGVSLIAVLIALSLF